MATYDLPITQGQRLRAGFRLKIDDVAQSLTGYAWRAQVREKEDPTSPLLLDLTAYLALDPADDTSLVLDVPATVTAAMNAKKATRDGVAWDLFYWPTGTPDDADLFLQGSVIFDASATDMTA